MNVVKRLAIKNLKLNKKRTISTVIGIILSTALICGTASLVTSVQKTLVQNAINRTGYYHLKLENLNESELKEIDANRNIKDIQTIERLGYAKLEGIQNEDKPYVKAFSIDNETFEKLKFELLERKIS